MSVINRSNHPTDLPVIHRADIQILDDPLFTQNRIGVDVFRLDKIHTIVSGNKWFKLKYYLAEVISQRKKGIITFGGPYSNHLLATAFACNQHGLLSIGLVRGEEPSSYSHTLNDARSLGMSLQFVSQQQYNDPAFAYQLRTLYPDFLLVEEGGRGQLGIKGAEEILQLRHLEHYTHIMCAVGTGTMIAGIINGSNPQQQIIGIPVIKISDGNANSIYQFLFDGCKNNNFLLRYDYHFGGYAKKSAGLISFMNILFSRHKIPTDFVYTGKLFFAAMNLIENNFFKPDSRILLIHSGGLQGNRSLPAGLLDFSF